MCSLAFPRQSGSRVPNLKGQGHESPHVKYADVGFLNGVILPFHLPSRVLDLSTPPSSVSFLPTLWPAKLWNLSTSPCFPCHPYSLIKTATCTKGKPGRYGVSWCRGHGLPLLAVPPVRSFGPLHFAPVVCRPRAKVLGPNSKSS